MLDLILMPAVVRISVCVAAGVVCVAVGAAGVVCVAVGSAGVVAVGAAAAILVHLISCQ